MMDKTKLDLENKHHQVLVALLATFVTDYEYEPRELFGLLDDAKRQTFHSLLEMYKEGY